MHKAQDCTTCVQFWYIISFWIVPSFRTQKVNFLFLFKNDQANRLFKIDFSLEIKVHRKWCTNSKMRCGGWGLGTRLYKMQPILYIKEPKYRSLDGVNTVVACWILITSDYTSDHIWLCKSSSSVPQADQKQEINSVWPYMQWGTRYSN